MQPWENLTWRSQHKPLNHKGHSSLSGWRRQWHPNPVLLPRKPHGRRSLVGCSPLGCYESDTTKRLHFHTLEKEMATHSSVLAWRIPGMGEPGGLPSMGSHRVGHDWSDLASSSSLSGQLWLILLCFTLRKLQLSISWNTFYSLCILINQVTQLTHHSIKNNYTRLSAGNAKTGAQNCSHAAPAALQSMAQRLQPHHQGRVKNTYSQGQILVGLGSQTWKSAFPRMPHMLLACGPENNLEKHRHSDNDTLMWQGLQRARWV